MYYRVCPVCGCNLDPGEKCDCNGTKKETAPLPRERSRDKVSETSLSIQMLTVKKGVCACPRN